MQLTYLEKYKVQHWEVCSIKNHRTALFCIKLDETVLCFIEIFIIMVKNINSSMEFSSPLYYWRIIVMHIDTARNNLYLFGKKMSVIIFQAFTACVLFFCFTY